MFVPAGGKGHHERISAQMKPLKATLEARIGIAMRRAICFILRKHIYRLYFDTKTMRSLSRDKTIHGRALDFQRQEDKEMRRIIRACCICRTRHPNDRDTEHEAANSILTPGF